MGMAAFRAFVTPPDPAPQPVDAILAGLGIQCIKTSQPLRHALARRLVN